MAPRRTPIGCRPQTVFFVSARYAVKASCASLAVLWDSEEGVAGGGKEIASMPRWSRARMLAWMGGEGAEERLLRFVADAEEDGSR